MTLWMVILGALIGCGSSTPEPTAEAPTASARGKQAKRKMKARKRKHKARRRAARRSQMPPVGAAGDVFGELVLTRLEEPSGAPKTAPVAVVDGTADAPVLEDADEADAADAAGEASGTGMVTRTKAELKLRWGTDGAQTVPLGKVKGTCAEGEARPVGPPGKEKTPLWSVQCDTGDKTIDLFILQIGPRISVVREAPGATADAPRTVKPVKRIPLAQGATLKRES